MARRQDGRGDSTGSGRQRDPRDVRIERLERDKARLIEERDHWKRRSEHLEKELGAAQRAGRRQAAPFAKDRPQGGGRRPGRRAGADYGKQGRRRPPTRVDETHAALAPTTCPDCGVAVVVTRTARRVVPRRSTRPKAIGSAGISDRFRPEYARWGGVRVECGPGRRSDNSRTVDKDGWRSGLRPTRASRAEIARLPKPSASTIITGGLRRHERPSGSAWLTVPETFYPVVH